MVWKIKPPSPPGVPAARVPSPTFALAAATARLICPENANRLVATVEQLGELHALTEVLDDSAAQHLPALPCTAAGYAAAWQGAGRAPARERQIGLTIAIGSALEGYTRSRLMRTTLRMMRGPAQAAGLQDLQRFLEAGFDAFGAMRGAGEFLDLVAQRERALAAALFAPDAPAQAALPPAARPPALAVLP